MTPYHVSFSTRSSLSGLDWQELATSFVEFKQSDTGDERDFPVFDNEPALSAPGSLIIDF